MSSCREWGGTTDPTPEVDIEAVLMTRIFRDYFGWNLNLFTFLILNLPWRISNRRSITTYLPPSSGRTASETRFPRHQSVAGLVPATYRCISQYSTKQFCSTKSDGKRIQLVSMETIEKTENETKVKIYLFVGFSTTCMRE